MSESRDSFTECNINELQATVPVYGTSSRQVDFGYVCFRMQYITWYTMELSASFLFWSGKVHMFIFWVGRPKTITSILRSFILGQVWASLHTMLHLMQIHLFWQWLALNQSLKSDKISVSLYLPSWWNILCSHISQGVLFAVGCQQDLKATELVSICEYIEHNDLHISNSIYLTF